MSKILVTGSSGFIGSRLTEALLAQGHEVTCLLRKSSRTERLDRLAIRRALGDVTDRESLATALVGQDVVYHLAGCLRALRVRQLYRVNEEGTRNVAWACARPTSPPVLVVVSSLAAVGPARGGRPRVETDPPRPVSNYGRSKLAGEQAVREFADRVPTTVVRPPIVFGEADPATREIFSPIAHLGLHLVPTWHDPRMSVIHADDLVNLFLLAAERGRRLVPETCDPEAAAQGCYFAAAERDVTFGELGRLIGHALGRRRTRILRTGLAVPWLVATLVTLVSQVRRRPWFFDLDKAREALAGSWCCSAEAAARDLGFKVAAPLTERLQQTARWYREHGWL
jgi:nucleoside-diphosphate-sugar epimerase